MQLQDPDEDLPDFGENPGKEARLRKLAEILRKTAVAPPSAAGTMVGGRYIAPSTSSFLAPMAQGWRADMADSQADDMAAGQLQLQRAQQMQWQNQMPQPTPGHDIPGPTEDGSSLGQTAPVPVTRDAVLKQTMAGMLRPSTAKMAKVYGETATKGIDAQDQMDFKSEENLANRQARNDNLEAQRQTQIQQTKDRIAGMASNSQAAIEGRAEIARLVSDSAHYNSDARVQAAQIAADAKRDTAGSAKGAAGERQTENQIENNTLALSKRMDLLQPTRESAQNVQSIIDDNTDPKTGKIGSIPGFGYGALKPTWLQNSQEAKNSAAIQAWANSVIRSQAGLSQTLSETQNQLLESLARGRGRQDQFLAVYPQVMGKLNATLDSTEAGHRPEAVSRYLDRGGNLGRVYSRYDKAGAAAEAARATRRATQSGREASSGKTAEDYLKVYGQ